MKYGYEVRSPHYGFQYALDLVQFQVVAVIQLVAVTELVTESVTVTEFALVAATDENVLPHNLRRIWSLDAIAPPCCDINSVISSSPATSTRNNP